MFCLQVSVAKNCTIFSWLVSWLVVRLCCLSNINQSFDRNHFKPLFPPYFDVFLHFNIVLQQDLSSLLAFS